MTIDALIDESGPGPAFLAAARAMGLSLDEAGVRARFEAHASPASLRALVEIASAVGVEPRAFKADVAALAEVTLPAVVHLQRRNADDTGFAALLAIDEAEVTLEDPSGGGRRTVPRPAFLREWTGIIVTLDASGSGAPRQAAQHAGWLWKLSRALDQGGVPREQRLARWSAGALGLALALGGAWRMGAALAAGPAAAVLAVAGPLLAALALVASFALHARSRVTGIPGATSRLASRMCGRGKHADCAGVLSSKYARVMGIDLASAGLALFGGTLAAWAVLGFTMDARAAAAWLALASLLVVPGSLWLIAVQIYPLRRFCPLCMTVHAAVLASAAIGAWALTGGGLAAFLPAAWPAALVHALLVAGSLGLLVPFLDLSIESRSSRTRLGWIGATPWGALAEIAGRPRALAARVPTAIELGPAGAPFRVEAMVHPTCSGCGPFVEKLLTFVAESEGLVSVGVHLPPKDVLSEADHALCTAIGAVGVAAGGEPALAAFLRVKNASLEWVPRASEGAAALAAALAPAGVRVDAAAVDRARAAVLEAGRLADMLERGTPTLLVEGRAWEASLDDLVALVTRQTELFAAILRVRLPARERGVARAAERAGGEDAA